MLRQDASPLNQQTTNARRHPIDFFESRTARPSNLATLRLCLSAWTVRGGNRDGPAGSPPSFMTVLKSAPREARLERSPALRWLRREVGPSVPPVRAIREGALPRCSRSEDRSSVLTPKEALRSPFPGGDHLFLATSTLEIPRRVPPWPEGPTTVLEGWRSPVAWILSPCSRGLLHSTTSLGTPLDRASPSTSPLEFMRPREWPHASRRVESETLSLIRFHLAAWLAGDSPWMRVAPTLARCQARTIANRFLVSIAHPGFPVERRPYPSG